MKLQLSQKLELKQVKPDREYSSRASEDLPPVPEERERAETAENPDDEQ